MCSILSTPGITSTSLSPLRDLTSDHRVLLSPAKQLCGACSRRLRGMSIWHSGRYAQGRRSFVFVVRRSVCVQVVDVALYVRGAAC